MPFEFQYNHGISINDDDGVRSLLTDMGIWAQIDSRGGLDTPLVNMRLSKAEMQLFGLSRAILQHRNRSGRLVLMDEATSALDTLTDERIQQAIRSSFPNCTILMIAHRQTTVRDAQRFIELSDGSVASNRDADTSNNPGEDVSEVAWDQLAESSGGGPRFIGPGRLRSGRLFRS